MFSLADYSGRKNKKLNTSSNFHSLSFLILTLYLKMYSFKKNNAVCNTERQLGLPAILKLINVCFVILILFSLVV